jgi:hypothetical protein
VFLLSFFICFIFASSFSDQIVVSRPDFWPSTFLLHHFSTHHSCLGIYERHGEVTARMNWNDDTDRTNISTHKSTSVSDPFHMRSSLSGWHYITQNQLPFWEGTNTGLKHTFGEEHIYGIRRLRIVLSASGPGYFDLLAWRSFCFLWDTRCLLSMALVLLRDKLSTREFVTLLLDHLWWFN